MRPALAGRFCFEMMKDYVILLLEHKYNDLFKQYMNQFFPNWRAVKETLNQQMLDYMEVFTNGKRVY